MLRMFQNRILWRKFGTKRDEMTGSLRKLHNEELQNLRSSPNVIRIKSRRMRWAEHVVGMGEEVRNAYRILVEKSEAKRLLGILTHRWEDNIKVNFM
jgi:hypothetical protein